MNSLHSREFFSGLTNSFLQNKIITKFITTIQAWVMIFMKKIFLPLLPLFISGFFLKLFKEDRLGGFISQNPIIYLKIIGFLWLYLGLWLAVAASFNPKKMWEIFKNALPAILTAFSTMSSAAALSLSIEAAKKNTDDKVLSDAVMPLTVNFHMIGDTMVVPIMSLMVLQIFNHPLPTVPQFIMFGIFFVLNKFAGGGVPSGTMWNYNDYNSYFTKLFWL
ncbi:MAG: dicarboxylate/amino acid:cation symporter [Cytophagales bacterium]|nr:dicarboxylate/amino acid:cation symporter [Cytophagales bacterium]